MKFKFNLEKVLNHRKIKLDIAQKEYMEALSFLNNEKEILNNLVVTKNEAIAERAAIVGQTFDWSLRVNQINDFLKGHDFRIVQQNERLLKIEKLVESRREILKDSLSEVKIMERLKENKRAHFLQEERNKENKELDEISTIRFVRMTKE